MVVLFKLLMTPKYVIRKLLAFFIKLNRGKHSLWDIFICLRLSYPNPGIEPRSPALKADSLLSEPPGKPLVFCHPKRATIAEGRAKKFRIQMH